MARLFLTGASGFLGSRLFSALRRRGDSIVVLDRSGFFRDNLCGEGEVEIVSADLLDSVRYQQPLASTDVAVHLAATTGRATREEHFRVNDQGTQVLLDQCRRSGVRKILFVSSIATKFPDKTAYYYAQAKTRAEESVRSSDLQFTIIRPTIILGRGAPILTALEKLAGLPVIPVFGDGKTLVQPIFVDDLIQFILSILEEDRFKGETLELGGPRPLAIEELLQEIRRARKGGTARSVHIPLRLPALILGLAEKVGLARLMPVSAGQLSSFRYHGTIGTNPLYESRRAALRDVRQMLELSYGSVKNEEGLLERECWIFATYLLGHAPDNYAVRKYVEAHAVSEVFVKGSRFDLFLVNAARVHRNVAKLADAYARLFAPVGLLRKKLVLLLAILETSSPSCHLIDSMENGTKLVLLMRLIGRGFLYAASIVVGMLVFLPAHLVMRDSEQTQ